MFNFCFGGKVVHASSNASWIKNGTQQEILSFKPPHQPLVSFRAEIADLKGNQA